MKTLEFTTAGFVGAEVLGRAQLKNIMGGVEKVEDYAYCYNVCMSGAQGDENTMDAKARACDDLCS